jgi:ACR3 family arsenite transporter
MSKNAIKQATNIDAAHHEQKINGFERYLSLWVALCMVAGLALGKWLPAVTDGLRRLEFGESSQINVPIAILIWLMIIPMMMKVDFGAVKNVGKRPRGLMVTLFVNWLVKPFSMALFGWIFFRHVFSGLISPADADQYIAGVIILAAAPCTAMVFVWSYLTDGDPAYTLVQVSLNDLIMLLLFAPIVRFLVSGASSLEVPFVVLLYSVVIFIVIPLAAGIGLRLWFIARRGRPWPYPSMKGRGSRRRKTARSSSILRCESFSPGSPLADLFRAIRRWWARYRRVNVF